MKRLSRDQLDNLLATDSRSLAKVLGELPEADRADLLRQLAHRSNEHDPDWIIERYHRFIVAAWPLIEPDVDFIDGWHIRAICDHLQELVFGDRIKNMLVNVPPGTSKSICCSVLLVPWTWTRNPAIRFLYASYEQGLSTRDSIAARRVIDSSWYQERWGGAFRMVSDQNEKLLFRNDKNGWRLATSVGGRGTGEHPDILISDDPHKVREMESETERRRVINWWNGTMSTRGAVRGVRRAVVGQRVHHDDVSGDICRQNGGDSVVIKDPSTWTHIRLPMRYEGPGGMPETPLGFRDPRTKEGDLLWKEAYDDAKVAQLERELGSVGPDVPAGQLQQRPTRRGGSMVKREWFEIVEAAPANVDARCRAWDKASSKSRGAFSCGVKVSVDSRGVYYIEDVWRDQVGPDGRHDAMRQYAELDHQKDPATYQIIEEEGGSAGKDAALYEIRLLAGYNVRTVRPTGSKEVRFGPVVSQIKAGNVKLVRGAWNEAFIQELEQFPLGKYKDQADATSGAFAWLFKGDSTLIEGDLLATGEDPVEESRPFDDDELEELPDYLKELVQESRQIAGDRHADW